uniref:Uncharacterized protein n=1 Tax=Arundo donax TaxID=35708 RepID=A0A0A8YWE0_ARUDO
MCQVIIKHDKVLDRYPSLSMSFA